MQRPIRPSERTGDPNEEMSQPRRPASPPSNGNEPERPPERENPQKEESSK